MDHQSVLHFWFDEIESKKWWVKDAAFDQLIRERFGDVHAKAARGELFSWRKMAEGRLAEIIVLDQFSRNMFRDTPAAFAQDALALVLAQEAVFSGADKLLSETQCSFLYMPFMHSESLVIHELAVELFSKPGLEGNLDFEMRHKVIIEKFGRYPHRNNILQRESTEEEMEFLKLPGSGF
jgi:uncharacterized protein (DUF924 family)